jgi:hypothetical protein
MAIVNGYCTLADVKAALRLAPSDTTEDALLENAIEAASRRIDGYCGTFFYQKQSTVELFTRFPYVCQIPDLALSSITLRTDDNGDGAKTFPLLYDPNRPAIQLTGTFGYASVPDDVREACVLLSMRGFARYNSALGIVGFADMAITVRAVDPDVRDYLMPYRQLIAI